MWDSIKAIYTGALRFARAAPLLFLVPVAAEMAQHVAEVSIGLFASREGARAAANDMTRLSLGYVKVLALMLPTYVFVRFLAFGDARRAGRPEMPAIALWGAQILLLAAVQFWSLFGTSLPVVLGLTGSAATSLSVAVVIGQTVLGIYLTAWFVAWPLGNQAIGPLRSLAVMAGSFWRTLGYLAAGTLPLMVVHQLLNLLAIGRPDWLVWPMLVIDASVVGFLALTMAGANYMAARDAAARKGVSLLP